MTEEVSRLALVVDSTQVTDANRELTRFERAGAAAEAAARGFERAMGRSSEVVDLFARRSREAASLAQQINQRLNVANDFGGAARAADVAAYGKALDDLRARYNPLYAAQQQYRQSLADINAAARLGAISESERAAAIQVTKTQFVGQVQTLQRLTRESGETSGMLGRLSASMGMTSAAAQQLTPQLNDIVGGLLMGQSPMAIMTQQGPQVVQALQMTSGGLAGVGRGLLSLVTPATVAVTGLLAIGAAGVAAVTSWDNAQDKIKLALMGIGRASGTTRQDINEIARSSASLTTVSVSQARDIATQLAAVGVVERQVIEPATRSVYGLAKVLGTDAVSAAGSLAQALADPVRGFDQLNARLGFGSDKTRELVYQMVASNNVLGAQQLILQGVTATTQRATEVTSFWSASWNAVTNAVSNTYDAIGRGIANMTGIGQTEQQRLKALEAELAELIKRSRQQYETGIINPRTVDDINRVTRELSALQATLRQTAQASQETKANLESMAVGATIRDLNPDIDAMRRLTAARDQLVRAMQNSGGADKVGAEESARFASSLLRVNAAIKSLMPQAEAAVKLSNLQRQAVDAQSPGARAAIAAEQMRIQLSGEAGKAYTDEQKAILIRNAAYQASGGLGGQLEVEQRRISALGDAATMTEAYALKLRELQVQLAQGAITQETFNRAVAGLKATQELDRMRDSISALGDAATDVERFNLRAAELRQQLQQGRISQETFNRALQNADPLFHSMKEGAADFTSTLIEGLMRGTSLTQSLASALSGVSSQLMRSGTQSLTNSLFGGASNALGGGANGGAGGGMMGGLASMLGLGASMAGPIGAVASIGIGIGGSLLSNLFGKKDEKARQAAEAAAKAAEEARRIAEQQQSAASQYRYQAAGLGIDTSSYAGAMRKLELDIAHEREEAVKTGGDALVAFEEYAAAQRLQISKQWAEREQRAREGYEDRIFRAGLDTSTTAGRLADFDRTAMREREEAVRNGSLALVELEQAQAAERGAIIRDALKEQTTYYDDWRKSIADFIGSLNTSNLSTLSPADQYSAAQAEFQRQYDLALSGDRSAQSGITNVAQTLFQQARDYLGPTSAYGELVQRITEQLTALPGAAMEQDPQVKALQGLGSDYLAPMTNYLGQIAVNTGGAVVAGGSVALPTLSYTNDNSAVVGALQSLIAQVADGMTSVKLEIQGLRNLEAEIARLQEAGNTETGAVRQEVAGLRRDVRLTGQASALAG